MKLLLVCFLVTVVVFAEDVFFYDSHLGQMVHRIGDQCYVMQLTQDQQDNVHEHDIEQMLQQLMRDLADDSNHTSHLPRDDASDFVLHHCHNRDLFRITQ